MRRWALLVLALSVRVDAQGEAGWELKLPERVELTPGATATLPISITVDRGLTISKDAGMIIDLAPDTGVSVKRRRLARTDAVDPDADAPRFAVPLHAEATGDFTLKVHARFWLCRSKTCRPIDARRTVAVAIAAPPAPDAGVDAEPDAGKRKAK